MPPRKIPQYDISLVREAAAKRWPEIIARLASVPLETLDGRHRPCPKCGGSDRFRMFTDESGGAICNQCFDSKNGDGFAVLAWLTGKDFPNCLHEIASYLGIPPEKPANGKRKKKQPADKADPAEHLQFDDQPVTENGAVGIWCASHKPGTTPAAIAACHGRTATYRERCSVIALPIWGEKLTAADPVGWCLYHLGGGKLPKFVKGSKQPEWVKVKLTYGSQPGWIGNVERLRDTVFNPLASIIWKVEGPTDALAALSLDGIPSDVAVIANANGAKERPQPWMIDCFEGKTAYVLHDADKPGVEGANWVSQSDGSVRPGWGPAIATKAKECRSVELPFEVQEVHGKDLRDWVNL